MTIYHCYTGSCSWAWLEVGTHCWMASSTTSSLSRSSGVRVERSEVISRGGCSSTSLLAMETSWLSSCSGRSVETDWNLFSTQNNLEFEHYVMTKSSLGEFSNSICGTYMCSSCRCYVATGFWVGRVCGCEGADRWRGRCSGGVCWERWWDEQLERRRTNSRDSHPAVALWMRGRKRGRTERSQLVTRAGYALYRSLEHTHYIIQE